MYRNLLSKKFFRDNPVEEMSAQRLAYSLFIIEEFDDAMSDAFMMEHVHPDDQRLARIADEKVMIQQQDDPDAIFQLLRKNLDVFSRPVLVSKALEYESAILPMVMEKLLRSDHDTFIENAVRILAKSEGNYSEQLRQRYSEFRSPYVKSLVCILLGRRAAEDIIPWMMDRFYEMESLYPDESYGQGPLLALYELSDRFYH